MTIKAHLPVINQFNLKMPRKVAKAKNSPSIKKHPSTSDIEALAAKKHMSVEDYKIDRRKQMKRGDAATYYAKNKKLAQ